MLLFISDANILIDIEIGGLVAPMFSLDYQFAVPDVLFYEELDEQHGYLLGMGLESRPLSDNMVARVEQLAQKYPRPGRMDLFALVLAEHEKCPLLTGDSALRSVADQEDVKVHGTLWLVEEMVKTGKISVQVARNAYLQMQVHGRRLPWPLAEQRLHAIEEGPQV